MYTKTLQCYISYIEYVQVTRYLQVEYEAGDREIVVYSRCRDHDAS